MTPGMVYGCWELQKVWFLWDLKDIWKSANFFVIVLYCTDFKSYNRGSLVKIQMEGYSPFKEVLCWLYLFISNCYPNYLFYLKFIEGEGGVEVRRNNYRMAIKLFSLFLRIQIKVQSTNTELIIFKYRVSHNKLLRQWV